MNFLVFDFETGGTDPKLHDPIQLAAVVLSKDLREVARFSSMIQADPDRVQEAALKVNKKTREEIAQAPIPAKVAEDFFKFCEPYGWLSPVGHNVGFDLNFLETMWDRHGQGLPPLNSFIKFQGKVCTVQLTNLRMNVLANKGIYSLKLTSLAKYFGLGHDAHDALGDVLVTSQLFRMHLKALGYSTQPQSPTAK